VEGVLRAAGVDVVLCADSHLCCGSAGTYSVLHPEIAHALRDRKVANLEATGAKEIVSPTSAASAICSRGRRRR
jgi:glycolate oxidase iron-sulfur subunit